MLTAALCITANLDRQCPLWVKSGRDALKFRCPLYPRKQTSAHRVCLDPVKTPDLLQPGLTHSIEEFD
jgi:hypothetical protein